MKLHRLPVVVALDTLIAHADARVAELRRARQLVIGALNDTSTPPATTKTSPRRTARPRAHSSGDLSSRVLAILREAGGEGLGPAAVIAAAKAPEYRVRLTLKELAADGKITGTGATTTKRYHARGKQ